MCHRSLAFTRTISVVALGLVLSACSTSPDSGPSGAEAPGANTQDRAPGSGNDAVTLSTDIAGSGDFAEARRIELAAAMATNRVARYAEAWTVLAEGARVAPGRIRLFYTRRIVSEADRASGANQSKLDFWNREHVWPRSFGIDKTAAETDLHNLVPVDATVNFARGNRIYHDDGRAHDECGVCLIGNGSWAPPLEVRGDAARIAFYMDVRYDGIGDLDVPDLTLGDAPETLAYRFGRLSTLLRWHCEDPVSAEEVQRHEAAASAQGNRNAFVDAPELVETVYGFSCP